MSEVNEKELAVELEKAKQERVKACSEKIQDALTLYNCALDAITIIKPGQHPQVQVSIVPA